MATLLSSRGIEEKAFLNSQFLGSSQRDTTGRHSAPSYSLPWSGILGFPAFPALLSVPSVTQTPLQPLKSRADLAQQTQEGWIWPWIPKAEAIKLIHVFLIKTFSLGRLLSVRVF